MMKVKYILTLMMLGGGFIALGTGVSATEVELPEVERTETSVTNSGEVDVEFTFDPVLTLSLSESDIVIADLIPGSVKNSNTVGITVKTNNQAGYLLSATVGSETNDYRDLLHTDGVTAFASVDEGANLTALSASTWGYSINSGTNFSGLAKWDEPATKLRTSTGASNETTNFLIGAKAAAGQLSGDYTNVINFIAVTNVDSGASN